MNVVKRTVSQTSVALVGVLVVVGAAPIAAAASRHPDRSGASSFSADTSLIRGHGELAVISRDRSLYLMGGKLSGAHKVALTDPAGDPAWSHDGRWLAVITQPAPPTSQPADEPTTIWLVSRAGKVVRRLTPAGQDVYHATAAWSPTADRLAISYTADVTSPAGATQRIDVVTTSGATTALASAPNISGFAWSPSGRRLAVGLNHFVLPAGKWRSRLVVFTLASGSHRAVSTVNGDILDVAGWWPDGSGVLAWRDYQGSGSLAADGLPLLDISTATGHRRQLTKTMLQYEGWLATSKVTNEVAFIAGGDRILTNGHKHLVVCSHRRCRSIAQPKRKVSFDPAWSPGGRLAVVRDRAVKAVNGNYLFSYTRKVDDSGGIALVRGRHVHALTGATGGTAPVWGRGGSMLFVRGSSLWFLRAGSTRPRRVAGPLSSSDSFYGFVSWWDSFAWTAAVADRGRSGSPQVI